MAPAIVSPAIVSPAIVADSKTGPARAAPFSVDIAATRAVATAAEPHAAAEPAPDVKNGYVSQQLAKMSQRANGDGQLAKTAAQLAINEKDDGGSAGAVNGAVWAGTLGWWGPAEAAGSKMDVNLDVTGFLCLVWT